MNDGKGEGGWDWNGGAVPALYFGITGAPGSNRGAGRHTRVPNATNHLAGYHPPALRIVEPGAKMSTHDPMLLKEEMVSWFVLEATPMLLGLEAGLWLQESAPYLLPTEAITGIPAPISISAASLRAAEEGPASKAPGCCYYSCALGFGEARRSRK